MWNIETKTKVSNNNKSDKLVTHCVLLGHSSAKWSYYELKQLHLSWKFDKINVEI